jgi:hypothetical protein
MEIRGIAHGPAIGREAQSGGQDVAMRLVDHVDRHATNRQPVGQNVCRDRWWIPLAARESVGEAPLQRVQRRLPCITDDGATESVKNLTDVVDAVTVIGVIVRPNDRVHCADVGGKQLLAHVGTGVYKDADAVMLDEQRGAAAPVTRLRGIARAPVIADPRHA